ncbi:cell filamentation protein Fic [Azospirillum thiophilum]|uniref:Cell filamentation protein Fic n=1 Tax=Azospirillum thiophilum TaxID=528244 RepID=A0AAC9EYK3_9PROT|nr:Fic family protein [Azospirillum thiophilum]ALG74979.1 cell filamentation protein Fic [Azospirillum thiophilum]KJR62367.1 cell filamentation protein Fic [Azospirillum thiophilum]
MALLDEIAEKKRALDEARPLPQEVVHGIADRFELDLTAAAAALEEVPVKRAEIKTILERGSILRHRAVDEQRFVLNHRGALELMARLSFDPPAGAVTERTVAGFHAVLYHGIEDAAGKYRNGPPKDDPAGTAPDPAKLRVSMSALSTWMRKAEAGPDTPPDIAFEAHHRLSAIRPFETGNRATALLLCNLILNRAGYPPVVVGAEDRSLYLDLVERAWSVGDKTPFRDLMLRFLSQSLDFCLDAVAKGESGTP